jgi:glycosyltransferase involved in cell wall biosynthesis
VSLIVPCRDEARTIAGVIDSLLAQDYPAEQMELLFVDGESADATRSIIAEYAGRRPHPAIRVISNPAITTPNAFNVGIRAAQGRIIFTLGAHTRYSRNYVSGAVAALAEFAADAVGSVAVTEPGASTLVARAIARALACRFGVGGSLMRTGVSRPREADTGSCPAYRRGVFDRIGRFNTALTRNQDIEFNLRLRRAGGRFVVDPRITSTYRARPGLGAFARNSFANGWWVVRGTRVSRLPFSPRHLAPLGFVSATLLLTAAGLFWRPALVAGAGLLGVYLAADVIASLAAARGTWRLLPALLVTFPVLHYSYGLGSLAALATLWQPRAPRAGVPSGIRSPSVRRPAVSRRQKAVAHEH